MAGSAGCRCSDCDNGSSHSNRELRLLPADRMERTLQVQNWRGFRRDDFPSECWAVQDDSFVSLPTQAPVDLITRDRFGNCAFSFEWCVPEGGNTGVLYRVSEEAEQSWQSGPELQLLDDRRHPDGADPLKLCGALYDLMSPEPRLSPAPATFHTGRVVLRDSTVEHWIAGVRVLTVDLESRGIRNRIETSKFAGLPLFACAPEGHLVLQHHGAGAAFRRLQIKSGTD
jgi:hypothetical protein